MSTISVLTNKNGESSFLPLRRFSASACFVFVILILSNCAETASIGNGTESHFLRSCKTGCEGRLECISGICTIECNPGGESCKQLSSNAICTAGGTDKKSELVCDVECKNDDDCRAVARPLSCVKGFCREPDEDSNEKPQVDASTETTRQRDATRNDTDSESTDQVNANDSIAFAQDAAERDVNDSAANGECIPGSKFFLSSYGTYEDLSELQELSGYEETNVDIIIMETKIDNLDILYCLKMIDGHLDIMHNEEFASLEGLRHVTDVGVNLRLFNNNKLENVDGLRSVASVGRGAEWTNQSPMLGILTISENDSLLNLNGLENLTYLYGHLTITNNAKLPTCEAIKIKTQLENNGWSKTATICGNHPDECGSGPCPTQIRP